MPFLLRTIRKHRWTQEFDWVPADRAVADVLRDLGTDAGTLSVWQIDDDRSNLERVLTAVAATRRSFDIVDYLLIDARVVEELGILVERQAGETPDSGANKWHRDLTRLTAAKLAELAETCRNNGLNGRQLGKKTTDLLLGAVSRGQISLQSVNEELAAKIREKLAS